MKDQKTDHGGLLERAYQYLSTHRRVGLLGFAALTLLLVISVLRLDYKEDISDFLPLDGRSHEAMRVYQDISGADRIFIVFQQHQPVEKGNGRQKNVTPDDIVTAIDAFAEAVEQRDTAGWVCDLTTQIDFSQMAGTLDFVYQNIPYFLTPKDYDRMEGRLSSPDSIHAQIEADKQLLLFPGSSLLADNISRDPLNLFTPVVAQLQQRTNSLTYELYDGHIFSPDMSRGIAMMRSPFGSSETDCNARLLVLLDSCCHDTQKACPTIEAHIVGGPAIAVGNAHQIKTDSLLSVSIAVVLILGLLFYSLRSSRNLVLIVVSIGWGWIFALGCLAVVHNHVSVIVIGISSVILGIAVNYPLHLIAHLSHTPDLRATLRELAAPLVVGNVTTVGAFLALVPLRSVALRDLGLFAAFLLVGTILFVLFCLPHIVKVGTRPHKTFINKLGELSLDGHRWIVVVVVLLTAVLGWFSPQAGFDTNLSHINYMTPEQRSDMDYFARLMADTTGTAKVYTIATAPTLEAALDSNGHGQKIYSKLKEQGLIKQIQTARPFLATQSDQRQRLDRWQTFVCKHHEALTTTLRQAARTEGFAPDAFADFEAILSQSYEPQPQSYFEPLLSSVLASSISLDSTSGHASVVDVLTVSQKDVEQVETELLQSGIHAFDIATMNSSIANHLSDDFNYIGWACGAIVFLFLWLSFGSLELAILSFIPMAVSWVWILGIMGLLDIEFNIVNIILATFIFGQGDDYTIFMTEGACYEYAYRRRMLASYKHSIILSALIMFIGIGTLILARHPALRSLAQLTIAGMFSVVLMAYLFPPLIFRWLVERRGQYRLRPLSFSLLLENTFGRRSAQAARQALAQGEQSELTDRYLRRLVRDRYRYRGADICRAVSHGLRSSQKIPDIIDGQAVFMHSGYGEQALLYALQHPDTVVIAMDDDPDKMLVTRHAAEGIAPNLKTK